jgi:hypothetical protein
VSLFLLAVFLSLPTERARAFECDRFSPTKPRTELEPQNGVCPVPLTMEEEAVARSSLNRLFTLPQLGGCAVCLNTMLRNKRVCRCSSDAVARSFVSYGEPPCNPDTDAMCLGAAFFQYVDDDIRACTLAHEWLHMTQDLLQPLPCKQLESFRLEEMCLNSFGKDNPDAPGHQDYLDVVRFREEFSYWFCSSSHPLSSHESSEPRTGGRRRVFGGRVKYSIFSHDPLLYGIPEAGNTTYTHQLAMTTPFDFISLGNFGEILLVCGLRDSTDTGVIQTLSVADGRVVEELATLELPGVHPFSLALGAGLYVLDTAQHRILVVEDGDGDGIPETLNPIPFARAIDFPFLEEALSIARQSTGLSVHTTDLRLAVDVLFPEEEFAILTDTDLDGTADGIHAAARRDFLTFPPGFIDLPTDSSATLRILATNGSAIELVLTDSTGAEDLGVLGTGSVGLSTNEGLVTIDVDLVAGTYVRLDDLTHVMSSYAARVNQESVPVLLASFTADRREEDVVLRWEIAGDARDHAGFHVHREEAGGNRIRISPDLLAGREIYEFVDIAPPGEATRYWLEDIGRDGAVTWHGPVSVEAAGTPSGLSPALFQNRPNPFRESTVIPFQSAVEGMVVLQIFDLAGREVARPLTTYLPPGHHESSWDGRDASRRRVAAGTYFYRLRARGGVVTRKLILL